MSEAECGCGWHGSADELVAVKGSSEDDIIRLCPRCDDRVC